MKQTFIYPQKGFFNIAHQNFTFSKLFLLGKLQNAQLNYKIEEIWWYKRWKMMLIVTKKKNQ